MDQQPTDRELSAYVDGELPQPDVARVASAVAGDPVIAARVATLTRLKSALAGLAEEARPAIMPPRSRRTAGMLALAASIGLVLAVGVWMLTGLLGDDDGWYDDARAGHIAWAQTPSSPDARVVDANLFLSNLERFGLPVQTPDLTSARLRLTYLRYIPAADTAPAALHLGYTGRRGCKITLWVAAAPDGLGKKLTESRVGALRGFRWRSGGTAYALFATGMAERRFTVIADKVYEATRRQRGLDTDARMALKSASSTAPPCRA